MKTIAVVGIEWIVLGGVLLALLLLGPKKIPELARSIGSAWAEFRKARKEIVETEETK